MPKLNLNTEARFDLREGFLIYTETTQTSDESIWTQRKVETPLSRETAEQLWFALSREFGFHSDTLSRRMFDGLTQTARHDFVTGGGKVVDM